MTLSKIHSVDEKDLACVKQMCSQSFLPTKFRAGDIFKEIRKMQFILDIHFKPPEKKSQCVFQL